MNTLPHEITALILSCLDTSTRLNAALVCKEWYGSLPQELQSYISKDYMLTCAGDGNISYLDRIRGLWDIGTTGMASRNGRYECLKYLCENGCRYDSNTAIVAISGGSVECLQYMHSIGCTIVARHLIYAAERSTVCLKYLYENVARVTGVEIITAAVRRSNIESLKYLDWYLDPRRDGYTLHTSIIKTAAEGQDDSASLVCIKYLHEAGYGWDNGATTVAVSRGNYLCYRYMVDNGCPCTDVTRREAERLGL